MKMTFNLCKKLIAMGKMDANKLDVYFAANRLTSDEYAELIEMMKEE